MWVGLWHGGPNYSAPYAKDHAEPFASLADAVEAHRDRYNNRDGRTPCVSEDSETFLYRVPRGWSVADTVREIERDGYPDRIIKIGPRGGIRVERA